MMAHEVYNISTKSFGWIALFLLLGKIVYKVFRVAMILRCIILPPSDYLTW